MVVKFPEYRVRQPKNLEKNTVFNTPSSEIFVYQPILTKLFTTVALGTSHIVTVKPGGEGGQSIEKTGKNQVFDTQQLYTFYLPTDFVQMLYNSSIYDAPYNDNQTTWNRGQNQEICLKKKRENHVFRYPKF
jgi:hypothetical protein